MLLSRPRGHNGQGADRFRLTKQGATFQRGAASRGSNLRSGWNGE